MLYLISDIHGDVTSFRKMLKKISFDPATDQMIVMGDIFDWNDEGISLLEFMSDYLVDGSMQLIKGNHELFAQMYIEGSMSERQWIITIWISTAEMGRDTGAESWRATVWMRTVQYMFDKFFKIRG